MPTLALFDEANAYGVEAVTLQAREEEAYLVGGSVRDLLLGREPKDFDVATDASPEEVRAAAETVTDSFVAPRISPEDEDTPEKDAAE